MKCISHNKQKHNYKFVYMEIFIKISKNVMYIQTNMNPTTKFKK